MHGSGSDEPSERSRSRSPPPQYNKSELINISIIPPGACAGYGPVDSKSFKILFLEPAENVKDPPPRPKSHSESRVSTSANKPPGIRLKIGATTTSKPGGSSSRQPEAKKKLTVSSAFCDDDSDDDETEKMPAFASMRMRNIGRNTPTSSGPNSFGKTKHGFCDQKKIFEKSVKEKEVDD